MQLLYNFYQKTQKIHVTIRFSLKGPAADATDEPQPWRLIVQPCDEDEEFFSAFLF
jgi:hypothetical protein